MDAASGQSVAVNSSPVDAIQLNERALAMVHFEATWFVEGVDRHDTIRARFGCSVEEYNLELNQVIDDPAALALDPLVVRRLRRNRDRRRRARLDGAAAEGTAGPGGRPPGGGH